MSHLMNECILFSMPPVVLGSEAQTDERIAYVSPEKRFKFVYSHETQAN